MICPIVCCHNCSALQNRLEAGHIDQSSITLKEAVTWKLSLAVMVGWVWEEYADVTEKFVLAWLTPLNIEWAGQSHSFHRTKKVQSTPIWTKPIRLPYIRSAKLLCTGLKLAIATTLKAAPLWKWQSLENTAKLTVCCGEDSNATPMYPTPRNALFVGWSRFLPPSNAHAHQSNMWAYAFDF